MSAEIPYWVLKYKEKGKEIRLVKGNYCTK